MIVSRIVDGKYVQESEPTDADRTRLAEMFASGQTPALVTDATFWQGRWESFAHDSRMARTYRKLARKYGVNPTGKRYLSQLAEFPGDPEAWVDGRGDIRRVLEKRGWGADGIVKVKPREADDTPIGPDVDPRLIKEEVDQIIEKVPAKDRPGVDVKDLTDKVYQKRRPKKKGK